MSIRAFLEISEDAFQMDLCSWTLADGTPADRIVRPGTIKNWGDVEKAFRAALAAAHRLDRIDLDERIHNLRCALLAELDAVYREDRTSEILRLTGAYHRARQALLPYVVLEDNPVQDGGRTKKSNEQKVATSRSQKKRGRPRKPQKDKVYEVVQRIIDNGDVERYGRSWTSLVNRNRDSLPNRITPEALRKRVDRELERRRNADKK
jgi:hypothetical protein